MNKCINLKRKINGKVCCRLNNEKCINCNKKNIEFKQYKQLEARTPLKQRTSKQAKLERNRTSLFTDNLELCFICTKNKKHHMHEIFCGRNKRNSMIYGLCLPICSTCHSKYQNDSLFNEIWHKKGQEMFNKTYHDLDFQKIFRINYLD